VQVRAVLGIQLDLVELSRLLKVDVALDLTLIVRDVAFDLLVGKRTWPLDNVQLVAVFVRKVWPRALVSADCQVAVAVEVGDRAERAVDRDLLVVGADSVAHRVVVREEARLQHWIVAWLPSFDHVARREVRLLDLGEVVFGVLGEDHTADVVVSDVEPVLGQVKDVVAVVCGFFLGHGGDGDCPCWEVAFLNGIEQVLGRPGVVLASLLLGFGIGEVADTLLGLQLDTGVYEAAVGLDQLVGVAGPAVHVSESVGCSEVGEKTQELQDGLRELSRPCPEGVPIADVGSRISLLSVDESRELRRVANEENRSVC
jgi:hypothetical protein